MALRILQPGIQPLGQFDGLDTQLNLIQGGEVGTIIGIAVNSGDKAAADADGSDGYVGVPPNQQRPVVTLTLAAGARPLFLLDEGTSPYYGTLFGRLVGGTAGQIINGTRRPVPFCKIGNVDHAIIALSPVRESMLLQSPPPPWGLAVAGGPGVWLRMAQAATFGGNNLTYA